MKAALALAKCCNYNISTDNTEAANYNDNVDDDDDDWCKSKDDTG